MYAARRNYQLIVSSAFRQLLLVAIMSKFRFALVQLKTGLDKAKNIERAVELVRTATQEHQARIVSLPVSVPVLGD